MGHNRDGTTIIISREGQVRLRLSNARFMLMAFLYLTDTIDIDRLTLPLFPSKKA